MALYKVTLHSDEKVAFTLATAALKKIMGWDFVRAHQFCKDAEKDEGCVLCIADEDKAEKYVRQLEQSALTAKCISL